MGTNGGYGIGRPKLTTEDRAEVLRRYDAGDSVADIADDYAVTTAAIYYHLKTTVRHVPLADRDERDQPTQTGRQNIGDAVEDEVLDLAQLTLQGDVEWMDDGLCSQVDPDQWFPEKGGTTRPAKAICADCPVQTECLDYALTNAERFGIWGGLSPAERTQLKKARQAEPITREAA